VLFRSVTKKQNLPPNYTFLLMNFIDPLVLALPLFSILDKMSPVGHESPIQLPWFLFFTLCKRAMDCRPGELQSTARFMNTARVLTAGQVRRLSVAATSALPFKPPDGRNLGAGILLEASA
jgi:hypothetical protein